MPKPQKRVFPQKMHFPAKIAKTYFPTNTHFPLKPKNVFSRQNYKTRFHAKILFLHQNAFSHQNHKTCFFAKTANCIFPPKQKKISFSRQNKKNLIFSPKPQKCIFRQNQKKKYFPAKIEKSHFSS